MKNFKSLFIIPIVAISLFASSCSSSSSKIALITGDMHATDVIDIDYADLKSKIDNKETFILTVQPDTACVCWSDFYPILKSYISEKHVIIYHIKYNSFGDKDNFGLNIRKGYTSFAISEDGVWRQNLLSESNDIFKSKNTFYTYMSEITYLPHYYYVNLEDVNTMFSSNEQSVIYFARNNCGDCAYVDKNVLKQYAQTNVERKNMYILDCESIGIRQYDENGKLTPESQLAWNAFKVQYGLASDNNEKYGFDSGYVPTFQVVKNSTYVSGCVYLNDTLTKQGDKYVVSNTFYTNKRLANLQYLTDFYGEKVLEGLEVSSSDVVFNSYWKQDAANEYHKPLLEAFLDYYLK